MFLWVSSL